MKHSANSLLNAAEVADLRRKLIVVSQTGGMLSESSDSRLVPVFKHDVDRMIRRLQRLRDKVTKRETDSDNDEFTCTNESTETTPNKVEDCHSPSITVANVISR